MKRTVLLLGCLLMMSIGIHAGELYRWVDKSGKVHYGDAPATEAVQIERKKPPFSATQNGEDLPYETRLAQQNFPVTIYAASNCSEPCQQARDFLSHRGIPFTGKTLLTQKEIDDFRQQSGSDQSPTLAVGRTYLKGFQADEWNRELDIAGYPKTAPYRAPKASPATAPGTTNQVIPVTLYVVDNCIEHCNRARNLLTGRGIPFSEKSLKTQEEIDAFKQLSGSDIAPTLEVGKSFLKGFQAEQWNNELDVAGYPKTAPPVVQGAPAYPAAQ